MTKFTSV